MESLAWVGGGQSAFVWHQHSLDVEKILGAAETLLNCEAEDTPLALSVLNAAIVDYRRKWTKP